MCNHLSFTRTVAGDDNDSLFSAWKLWWCRNSLRYLMTLHFNIALTKCNRTLYNIHWRHGGFHTHVKAWQEIGEQIFMCTGELRTDSYAARCQDCFYRTKTDALWLVLIHCLHFPPPPPYLKSIHNKVRILVQGGGVFIPRCFFLISSVFFYFLLWLPLITSSPQSEINSDQSSVSLPPLADPRFWGFLDADKRVSIC